LQGNEFSIHPKRIVSSFFIPFRNNAFHGTVKPTGDAAP
jgi:hypothetical protein